MHKTIYTIEKATHGMSPIDRAEFITAHYPKHIIDSLKGWINTNSNLFGDELLIAVTLLP